jgi:hypothetical protein
MRDLFVALRELRFQIAHRHLREDRQPPSNLAWCRPAPPRVPANAAASTSGSTPLDPRARALHCVEREEAAGNSSETCVGPPAFSKSGRPTCRKYN